MVDFVFWVMFLPTARKPAQRFFFGVVICWGAGGGVGGAVITSCVYVIMDFLTHFMLRYTHLLHFGEHTSCYVTHFCCILVNTLHATLYTSVALR